ncbi:hypothetical protein CJP74_07020 [Psittacicella melopsittaci]|uniref:HTH arsR-type domain-containing protein n=1 Tax=Psittacicella melopsittaci TaxID=2028576 RepID=A0A3A1Y1R5_9GAMM|nr:metalloregulator ArsR/SmtB family transcription factor [Psittacicella melopsittaci]RIY31505.1 hypothetical protein CJP74_07020 [Psittacicella melopsittaci]
MDISQYSEIASALANENRVKIMHHIANNGEQCAQSLLDHFEFSQPTMSQHLRILRQAKLLVMRKEGRWQYFAINTLLLEEFYSFAQENFIKTFSSKEINPAYANRLRFDYKRK